MSRVETVEAAGAGRFSEIDHLKAIGILAVILIHSIRVPWNPHISALEIWIGNVTRFAVPAFLFCSGFLYATRAPIARATVLRRLRRVLVPYGIASVGAQLWLAAHGEGRDPSTLVEEILLGSSFGPYYYVFVHFWLVLLAAGFARLPMAALWGLTGVLLVAQGLIETHTMRLLSFFWHLRDPLLWWGYFLVGWMLRLHYGVVRAVVLRHRGALVAAASVVVAAVGLQLARQPGLPSAGALEWAGIYGIIALVFVATCARGEGRAVRVVADATFAIYLFHLFFVYAAQDLGGPVTSRFGIGAAAANWCAGLLGSLALVAAVRRALGPRSRDVIGA